MGEGVIDRLIRKKSYGHHRKFFDMQFFAYNKKKWLLISLGVLILLVVLFYLVFVRTVSCNSVECFFESMEKCRKASHISEVQEATWRYTIEGTSKGECEINVELLQAREGTLRLEELEGLEMSCFYPKGEREYPETELDNCEGKLKEELQALIIEGLHGHILENLDKIKEEIVV